MIIASGDAKSLKLLLMHLLTVFLVCRDTLHVQCPGLQVGIDLVVLHHSMSSMVVLWMVRGLMMDLMVYHRSGTNVVRCRRS